MNSSTSLVKSSSFPEIHDCFDFLMFSYGLLGASTSTTISCMAASDQRKTKALYLNGK